MDVPLEIERKWLVRDVSALPFDLDSVESHRLEQSYVSFRPQIRIRSFDGERFVLTVKGHPAAPDVDDIVRVEYELEISEEEFLHLREKTEGRSISKTRYLVPQDGGLKFEIDLFEGMFAGLVVAEMEFPSVEAARAYPDPVWAERDISDDKTYSNVKMAQASVWPPESESEASI